MKLKTIFCLSATLLLASCGSKIHGKETTEAAFEEAASERTDFVASGYTKANMSMKHSQKINGNSSSANYTANYVLSTGMWEISDTTAPSSYASMVNLSMELYKSVFALFKEISVSAEQKFYLADDAATVTMTCEINTTQQGVSMVGNVDLTVSWDKYGLITDYYEKDDWKEYAGYTNVSIIEDIKFTYSK